MRRMRFRGVRFVLFGIVLATVMGFAVSGLWNALIPAILHLPVISFWQALGLLVLSRILFGRFGGAGGWGHRLRKARIVRGMGDLTPEERDRFRRAMGAGAPEKL